MSIDAMKDIHLPAAPSYWPLPWTVWALLLTFILILLFGYGAYRFMRQRKKNNHGKISRSFRQEALLELRKIHWEKDNPAQGLQSINLVLKRVAITRFKRIEVSALTGEAWLDYLNQATDKPLFSASPSSALGVDCFNPKIQLNKSAFKTILVTAKQWIEQQ